MAPSRQSALSHYLLHPMTVPVAPGRMPEEPLVLPQYPPDPPPSRSFDGDAEEPTVIVVGLASGLAWQNAHVAVGVL